MPAHLSMRDALAAGVSPGAAELLRRQTDRDLDEHALGVCRLTIAACRMLDLDEVETAPFARAALFHDAGKLEIAPWILERRGPLSPAAWRLVRTHPERGERLVAAVPELADIAPIVRHHHERWDGAGYPDGLAGEDIPLGARIVFACDALDAMTAPRCYRPTLSTAAALDEVRAGAGTQFDPMVAAAVVESIAPSQRFIRGTTSGH